MRGEQITDAQREQVRRRLDDRVKRFEKYFPPGSWALQSPKIVESKQGKLLFQEYENLDAAAYPSGAAAKRYQVRLRPLAMVFTPDASAGEPSETEGQAIVLEAANGAVLEFDEPLDLRRVQVGRLIGGRLLGPISIRSQGKLPGTEDDLWVVARQDVELTEQYVRAPARSISVSVRIAVAAMKCSSSYCPARKPAATGTGRTSAASIRSSSDASNGSI